jgi:ATP/maltotriose-dependent transcriptional regulator MalT
MPRGAVLVLEDVHRLPSEIARELVGTITSELLGAVSVIVTSCAGPGAESIQLIAVQRLAVIDWEGLRFTRDEMAAMLPVAYAPFVGEIIDATEGWVTGAVLLLSASREDEASVLFDSPSVQERLADYFAGEIMAALTPKARATALQLAPLTDFSKAVAAAWCSDPLAAPTIDGLAREHCFLERDHGERYRFHPLFRRFLLAQTRFSLGDDGWRAWMMDAARLLAANEGDRSAVRIYVEIGAWSEAAQTLARLSTSLRRNGERTVLLELTGSFRSRCWRRTGDLPMTRRVPRCSVTECHSRSGSKQRMRHSWRQAMWRVRPQPPPLLCGRSSATSAICEQ